MKDSKGGTNIGYTDKYDKTGNQNEPNFDTCKHNINRNFYAAILAKHKDKKNSVIRNIGEIILNNST